MTPENEALDLIAASLMLADGRRKTVSPKLRFAGRRPQASLPRINSKRPAAYF